MIIYLKSFNDSDMELSVILYCFIFSLSQFSGATQYSAFVKHLDASAGSMFCNSMCVLFQSSHSSFSFAEFLLLDLLLRYDLVFKIAMLNAVMAFLSSSFFSDELFLLYSDHALISLDIDIKGFSSNIVFFLLR